MGLQVYMNEGNNPKLWFIPRNRNTSALIMHSGFFGPRIGGIQFAVQNWPVTRITSITPINNPLPCQTLHRKVWNYMLRVLILMLFFLTIRFVEKLPAAVQHENSANVLSVCHRDCVLIIVVPSLVLLLISPTWISPNLLCISTHIPSLF